MRFAKALANCGLEFKPGADGGAALREGIEFALSHAQTRDRRRHLGGIAGEFLTQSEGSRVHGMGAADLDDFGELPGLPVERGVQPCQRRQQVPLDRERRGDMHGGRDRVVGRLAHIDVIVRMHRLFGAEFAAERQIGGVGDHLVDVHVGLRAGTGLPHQQREMPVQPAVGDVLRHRDDRLRAAAVERTEIAVDLGGGALDQAERTHDLDRHAFRTDAEIVQRALGLRAPQPVGGDSERPEGVAFNAGFCRFSARSGHGRDPIPEAA